MPNQPMPNQAMLNQAMLNQLVVFTLDAQPYALRLASVQRVVRSVEVTPLPKAPDIVLGVIDVQGTIVPVVSMRKRFSRPEPEANLSGQLILADTATRNLALVVDSVTGVVERTVEQVTQTEQIVAGAQYVEGITRLEDGGILFIHDIDCFLSKKEDQQLDGLMAQAAGGTVGGV
jgi:purine-binding chemotaxis protein CheW